MDDRFDGVLLEYLFVHFFVVSNVNLHKINVVWLTCDSMESIQTDHACVVKVVYDDYILIVFSNKLYYCVCADVTEATWN